jgi:hypothetical protein
MFSVVTAVQKIMTEFNGAVSDEDKIVAITKLVLNLMKKNGDGVHRSLKVIAFNANGVGRQRYEFSKQLQDLRVGIALFSGTHLKPHESFFVPNYHLY